MSEIDRCAPSMFLIARRAPSAVAQDEDIYLTVAVAAPTLPDHVETMDIYLTVDFARPVVMMYVRFPLSLRNVATRWPNAGSTSAMRLYGSGGTAFARCLAAEIRENASRTCAAILSGVGIWMRSL